MTEVTIYWDFQPALWAAFTSNCNSAEVRLEPTNPFDADAHSVLFAVGRLAAYVGRIKPIFLQASMKQQSTLPAQETI